MASAIELDSLSDSVTVDGFFVVPRLITQREASDLLDSIQAAEIRTTRTAGIRNLASAVPAVEAFARSEAVRAVVDEILGPDAQLVRSILFDKVEGANWNMGWHQDITIAVRERRDVVGYGPWSVKGGVVSVRPPASVLENMISVRIHLDACGADNGALLVLPTSHSRSIPDATVRKELRGSGNEVVCATEAGGALVMRPLLLHASLPSKNPAHRRIVHLDFAIGSLAGGLEWNPNA